MKSISPLLGMGTLVNHVGEGDHPLHAHAMPIFETSTFAFEDAAAGASLFKGESEGYIYTRLGNPNATLLAQKIAVLEGLDLLRAAPGRNPDEIVAGMAFSSGMAAVVTTILSLVKQGQTIVAHECVYGTTYSFLKDLAPTYGIKVVWTRGVTPADFEEACKLAGDAALVFAETPANPVLTLVDLEEVAQIAHAHGAWLVVDNTFASPYCQRPLTLGADIVVHSTTKYLSGHGLIIGGAVVSRHPAFIRKELTKHAIHLGGVPSPFDAWLACIGLKTFEVRMRAHCENAQRLAE
ncbi:aminotransferase class I/II-fold pyridoxal phosphate-dependent enzyme, partial [bacterium]|nr:aminotransferase class I/II-fold pyridoxal phosphate-dependent enzyme [bacterium]